MIKKKI